MSTKSKIEWTEQTWNPAVGCSKVSPGCTNCYAEVMAKRLQAMKVNGYQNGFELTTLPKRLEEPLMRQRSTVFFVNSMSDLFHEEIPFDYIDRVFEVIAKTPRHTYQVLTKRAERMATYFAERKTPPNVWLGVTVEDRKHGLPRIDHLRQIQACIRFLSMEPLLEDLGPVDLTDIQWVIVGGESGPKARPMRPEWPKSIQRQCQKQGAAFFFKQWGGWGPDGIKRAKKKNGRILDGRTWDETPAMFG
ncbi:MAG: phage Gp37/Gp68 family protein [Desulfuromonadales bacterium]|nr:phage Gp37/Gp68 family protein [Desulfuromonadales bacterium]MDW7756163.1 phage Gp37/Gp68 family protein [Desulfuromonadales bacterium]